MKRRLGILIIAAGIVLAAQVSAQGPEPFVEFTFKRMKVPSANIGSRITVQIDPDVGIFGPARPKAEVDPTLDALEITPPPPSPEIGVYDWYWSKVSPSLAAASSGRLERAVNSLSQGPDGSVVAAPRLQDLQDIAISHGIEILKATIGTQVSPALVLAVIGIESSGRSAVESSAGATGLMQLMPATAERFGVKDATDPSQNIKGGVAYLDWLMNEFGGDPILTLAAYNAGENSVKRHEGVPPFVETREYVPKVLAAWTVARGLCLTPPQLVSDGCVFAALGVAKNG